MRKTSPCLRDDQALAASGPLHGLGLTSSARDIRDRCTDEPLL
jgi:hypothetical protein